MNSTGMPKPQVRVSADYREVLRLDFHNLELRVIAKAMLDIEQLAELNDFIGKALVNNLMGRPINLQTLVAAEEVAYRSLRGVVARNGWSMDWFEIVLPQLIAERERIAQDEARVKAAEAAEREHRRQAHVGSMVTRVVNAVRLSHLDTLALVLGGSGAAETAISDITAALQAEYADATIPQSRFKEMRDFTINLVNSYISGKLESHNDSQTVVNNVNIHIPEGADARLIQKSVNDISHVVLEMNGALPENQMKVECNGEPLKVVMLGEGEGESFQMGNTAFVVAGKPLTVKVDAENLNKPTHTETEESPCLEGLKGSERVDWLINNVPATYLAANLDMYCETKDIVEWMFKVHFTKETIGEAFKRLYGYNPIETNWIPVEQHKNVIDELSAQINQLEGFVMERDEVIANQAKTIDKQNTNITSLSGASLHAQQMLGKIKDVMSGNL